MHGMLCLTCKQSVLYMPDQSWLILSQQEFKLGPVLDSCIQKILVLQSTSCAAVLKHDCLQVGKAYLLLSKVYQKGGTVEMQRLAKQALQRSFDIIFACNTVQVRGPFWQACMHRVR